MNDTVERAAVIDALGWGNEWEVMGFTVIDKDDAIRQIKTLPSAEPERKKGHWIYKEDLRQFFCGECGEPSLTDDDRYFYGMDFPNFCPACGADMRGEE